VRSKPLVLPMPFRSELVGRINCNNGEGEIIIEQFEVSNNKAEELYG